MPVINRDDFSFWLQAMQHHKDRVVISKPTTETFRLTFTVDIDSDADDLFRLTKETDDYRKRISAAEKKREAEEAANKEALAVEKLLEATETADKASVDFKTADALAILAQSARDEAALKTETARNAAKEAAEAATFTGRDFQVVVQKKTVVAYEIKQDVRIGSSKNVMDDSIQDKIGESTSTFYVVFEDGDFKNWVVGIKRRADGATATNYDSFWYSPIKRYQYRSKSNAAYFVELINDGATEDEADASVKAKNAARGSAKKDDQKKRKLSEPSV